MIIITLRTSVFEDVLIILSATKGPNRRVRKDLASEVMLSCCCCSVAQSYPTLQPHGLQLSRLPSLSFTISQSLLKPISIESVMPSNHLILCRPLLLLPSIFPRIRVFSNESVLHIRWPKYWNFSFSISPSNVRVDFLWDWLVWSPCCPRDSKESSPAQFKSINSSALNLLYGPNLTSVCDYWKNHNWLDRHLPAKWCLCFWYTV